MNNIPYKPLYYEDSPANCPICNAYAKHVWSIARKFDLKTARQGGNPPLIGSISELTFSQCESCNKHTVWLENEDGVAQMVYPINSIAPLPNSEMQGEILKDYEEARSIVELSPRGAVALLRLVVQKLCLQLGEKGKNINDDIANLVKNGLPETMQKALDSVRVIGNQAVHPGVLDLSDDRETAYKLFRFVNLIVQYMITQPKEINEVYEFKLPNGAKEAIENRDSK